MSNIAFIGPCQMVSPLKLSGIDVFGCETTSNLSELLGTLYSSKKYEVIFITERMAIECQDKIKELENKINIVLLPDHKGSTGFFKEKLNNLIKQATGAVNI